MGRILRHGSVVLAALLLLPLAAHGQQLATGNLTAATQEVTGAPGQRAGVMADIAGTFSGTVTFACAGGESTYTNLLGTNLTDGTASATTTTTGKWFLPNAGCTQIRARMTSYSSGTATVTLTAAWWSARIYNPIFGTVTLANGSKITDSANGLVQITDSTGGFGLQVNAGAAAPTVGTCGTGTISATSRNIAGTVTATGAAACTVTFGTPAFTNTPACTVTATKSPTTAPYISAVSTLAFTVSGLTSGDNLTFAYACPGTV